ncbi:MAG: protoglobin domain-containing protein [Phycisphaerales bacterium]
MIRPTITLAFTIAVAMLTGCASTEKPGDSASYTRGAHRPQSAVEPVRLRGFCAMTEEDFSLLKKSVLFTDDDVRYLRMSRGVLEPNVGELLDVWYGFVGSNDHLLRYFSHPKTGEPNGKYLERVRVRFGQWVLDTADANFDQAWLNRQLEYGLRHHRLGKNRTDGVDAAEHIHFRYLVALHYPITTTLKPFLAKGGHSQQDIDGMYEAWRKAVLMTTILWSQPYLDPHDY